jgi:hypothetical protein
LHPLTAPEKGASASTGVISQPALTVDSITFWRKTPRHTDTYF